MNYKILMAVMAIISGISGAKAADIDLDQVPEVAIASNANHWYGKVFAGGAITDHAKVLQQQSFETIHNNMGNAFIAGFGAGYRLTDLLRADVSYEYRAKNSMTGISNLNNIETHYQGDTSAHVFMANGYFDMGTVKNITPYLGAGLGTSGNKAAHFVMKNSVENAQLSSATNWDFAWAVHAGFGVKLNPTMTLDIGYSYSDFGNAKTGNDDGKQINLNHLTSNDIKIGLRYAFK